MKLPNDIKSIAILRALQLGDMLCIVPAVRALRQAYPNASIILIGLPWAASFVKRFDKYFDGFMHFPGYPGLPEQEYDQVAFIQFINDVAAKQFDLVLQMQGNGSIVNDIIPLFKAKYSAGFYNDESNKLSGYFMRYPDTGHEVHRHIKLMEHLGIEPAGDELEFPLAADDHKAVEKLCVYLPPQKYVCIHPGSRGRWRQWPPKYFAALGDICVENGFSVIVTGTKEERDITRELVKCMHHPVIDFTGNTSVGAVALLLKNAYMLIANCTGVSHIAAATETKSIIISMDGQPERWGPLNHALHQTIDCSKSHRFDEVLANTIAMIKQQQPELKRA